MAEQNDTSCQRDHKPGRPRDPETDRAILQATLSLLVDQGYAGMSVERVASEAGVGKATIYRRYASKEELAAAALGSLIDHLGAPPNTGSARMDMIVMLRQNHEALIRGPGFAMIGTLLVEERRNPELLEVFRRRVIHPRKNQALEILRRGVERGEIRPDAELEVVVQVMIGALYARHIIGVPESGNQIEDTVDTVWRGLAIGS